MTRLTLFVATIFLSKFTFGEVVTCKSTNNSSIKKIHLVRAEHDYNPQWLDGEVDLYTFGKAEKVVVVDAPRKENLNYVDYEFNDEFLLELGPYHGPGIYPKAKATYVDKKRNRDPKLTAEMSCVLSGPMKFKNFCETTTAINPEKNLMIGVKNHDIGLVLSTLACGIDVNTKDNLGCTPILITADRNCGTGKFDIFSSGAYSDKIILSLLDNGAMSEDLDPITLETPLHKLVRFQDLRAISSLLKLEVNFDAQDKDGFTPLMRAVETASASTVDAVVSAGASLSLKNNLGQTATDIATADGFTHLLPYLVEATNLEIVGTDDGKCAPLDFKVKSGTAVKITLKSESNKMYMLSSKGLDLSLMANAHSSQSQRIAKLEVGEYRINCGVHGGQQNQGKIVSVRQ